jgi:hypothetical protein
MPACVFFALGLTFGSAAGQSSEQRTFTSAQGKTVQAKLVAVQGVNVTIETANGQKFTLPVASLSAADQEYLKTAPTPVPGAPNTPSSPARTTNWSLRW